MKTSFKATTKILLMLAMISGLSACKGVAVIDSTTPETRRILYVEPGDILNFEVTGPTYGLTTRGRWILRTYANEEPENETLRPVTGNPSQLVWT